MPKALVARHTLIDSDDNQPGHAQGAPQPIQPDTIGFSYTGTSGDDTQTGTDGNDAFNYGQGGNDTLNGAGGDDIFNMKNAFNAFDKIDGGSGNDTLVLDGASYSLAQPAWTAATLQNVETIKVAAGHSYNIQLDPSTVAAGATLTVLASALGTSDALSFNALPDTNGTYIVKSGAGADRILLNSGIDTVVAGAGNDQIGFNGGFQAADTINGGTGFDTLALTGDYSAGLAFNSATIRGIEDIIVTLGFDYKLTTVDDNVAAGQQLQVDASSLSSGHSLFFDGEHETDGRFLLVGGAGNDTLIGGKQADTFEIEIGGNDTVGGNGGDDIIVAAAALTAVDQINGGTGNDTLTLDGEYINANSLLFTDGSLNSVETISVASGFDYALTLSAGNVTAGHTLTLDASEVGSPNIVVFDGEAVSGNLHIKGGSAGMILTLGAGNDIVTGGVGNDFVTDSHFNAQDRIDGGGGNDGVNVFIAGSEKLTLAATTIVNVETLSFVAEPNSGDLALSLVTNDANVAAGATLRILSGSSVGSSVAYTFDGSAETDGHFEMDDNTGNDHLTGGALSDLFYITGGGDDTVNGGGGDDVIQAGAAFTAADKISGGQGNDTLELSGDYSGGVTLALNTLHSVETIKLDDNNTYKLTPDDANVAAGATLIIDATALEGSNALILNGSHELDGHFVVKGGDGNDIVIGGGQSDTLFGGNGNDEFEGQGGADLISGGAGADIFEATETSDSTGAAHDTIVGFDTSADRFLLGGEQVKQIEAAVIKGGLNAARFDTGLEAAIGKAQLSVHGAVVFTPSVGDLKGHVFLIVDENGHAGYQAGQDYVFELKNAVDLNHLATTNFS